MELRLKIALIEALRDSWVIKAGKIAQEIRTMQLDAHHRVLERILLEGSLAMLLQCTDNIEEILGE